MKPGLSWRPQHAEDARVVENLSRQSANREWSQAQRQKCIVVNKTERRDLKSVLTSHVDIKRLEFAQLVCDLVLVQHFLTILPFLCYKVVVYL